MAKLVSVITSAYNAADTLQNCVDSIKSQSYAYWEHIIVDDGSIDNTWNLLSGMAASDPRIKILHQANMGQAAGRNAAVRIAKGDYIALLDADDYSVPDRLALQVDFLEDNQKVDVLGGAIFNVSATGIDLGQSRLPGLHEVLAKNIFRMNPFFSSTVMARKRFFSTMEGFFVDLPRSQDYDLWLRGYRRFRYHNLQVPLTYYKRKTAPNWRDARYFAIVVMRAIKRDKKPINYYWFVLRPLVATLLHQLRLRKPY